MEALTTEAAAEKAKVVPLAREFVAPGPDIPQLIEDWRTNRRATSAAKMANHPSYRRIIELGKTNPNGVVPLLLKELENRPDHWFIALFEITGAAPVPHESRGNVIAMANAWVKWGRENGFTW